MMQHDQSRASLQARSNPSDVLRTMLVYSIMMVTLPISLYFATRHALETFLGWKVTDSYLYATGVAVVTVHIILGMFVYQAYKEPVDDIIRMPMKED